ncbi:5'-nucleotidase, lipoprotein e(P4) family [Thermoactinomyces sp. DSM 45892]|uniref:5'-nucleotidase, lipoprotein e(P4) family n=1 Tax=Thermoactinomyces sp. DSM 45892 TaxID=1882753 RepID=UPI000897D251|nr:5'-nucleotidase, lipoprotein e(P4) family [Thermoactinomyces sp. DSM 45892]SDZ23368.1 acid phosphatase [Thermoactinomyces sp. DSM 45892]
MNRMMKASAVVALSIFSLVGCQTPTQDVKQEKAKEVALSEQQVMADVWFQTAGESKALYYQGYNIGKMKLDEALKKKTQKKPAIVLDLDETVLDNSPYQAMTVKEGKGYPYKWDDWIQAAKAEALPGAVPFLQYANEKGVSIYYISNRKQKNQLEATIKNMKNLGIPQADTDHVLLQSENEKGKDERRKKVTADREIVLFFGDNLSDFQAFDQKNVKDRNQAVDKVRSSFGDKFIVFPNPMYGDWESAVYQYDLKKSDADKDKARKDALRIFEYNK